MSMNLETSQLNPAEQAQLAGLLAKLNAPVETPTRKKRKKSDTIKYLTEAELEKLFSVITDPRDRAIFRIAYHRGLRASELGAIQADAYNEKSDRLRVQRLKGSNGGEYHLTSKEVRALRAWLAVRGRQPGALFLSRHGRPISRQMLDVLMKKYGEQAGLSEDKRHMHCLKHSCATHLLTRGESLEDVQDHLGHVSIKSTQEYAKFTSQRRQLRDRRLRDW